MRLRPRSPRDLAAIFLLVLSLVVFGLQLRSLYTVPVFDAARWGGDETWLMREFVHQAEHGALIYPESFGEPVRTNGVLAGSMWGNALIYGVSGIIFFPQFDYVSIGRTVTAILALLLIGSLYFISRRIGVSPFLSASAVAVMVLSKGFVLAAHSARYDLLTGLVLIWYCYYLSKIEVAGMRQTFIAGALGIFTICFSPHLLTLSAGASLAFLIGIRMWQKPSKLSAWIVGTAAGIAVLSVSYMVGSGEFSLFGRGGKAGIFSFVLNEIPILRPFSRNVQLSNITERFQLLLTDLPEMLFAVGISMALLVTYYLRRRRNLERGIAFDITFSKSQRFFLYSAFLCTLLWLLTEGSRPYYLFHIAPMLLMACGIIVERSFKTFSRQQLVELGCFIFMSFVIIFGLNHAIPDSKFGEFISHDQQSAVTTFLQEVRNTSQQKSRILFDVAGLDRALMDTSTQVLTLDMFQPPPNAELLVNKLRSNNIDYIVLRSSPAGTAFEPGRALIPHVLDSIGVIQDSMLGFFYDDGRSYGASIGELRKQGLDTLRLYRLRKN
jgi:hypothetical protein